MLHSYDNEHDHPPFSFIGPTVMKLYHK